MPKGFSRTPQGFRAWVRVSAKRDDFNVIETKRFPRETPETEIRAWRLSTRAALMRRLDAHRQLRASRDGSLGTFRADATRYLNAIRAMPTYLDRCRDISLWVDVFGDDVRVAIRPIDIRTVRDRWLTAGPRRAWRRVNGIGQWIAVAAPLAPSTVNHRLRALSNMWTVLDGRRAPNPVREVPEVGEPQAVPRALDYQAIRRALAAMPDRGVAHHGAKRPTRSLAKIRTRVMAWTGITPRELALIQPHDILWDNAILVVPPRRKGRGAAGRIVPMTDEALKALRAFDAAGAYGRFSARVVLRAWQLACRRALGRPVRLYDLRHSFVTGIVRATKNLETAQLLAGHRDARTTRRYAIAAIMPTLKAGIEAFEASIKQKESP